MEISLSHGYKFTYPRLAPLRWLLKPSLPVAPELRDALLLALFNAPQAVVMGLINGVLLNVVALVLTRHMVFAVFLGIDLGLSAFRYRLAYRSYNAAKQGRPTPTDAYLITGILWCALQGAMALVAMASGRIELQALASVSAFALIGPISARNYPAPRLALLLISLCDLQLVTGGVLSGDRWLLVLLPQTPLFLFGCMAVILRFHKLAIGALRAQHESEGHARHDPLTGLLNRAGLSELLARRDGPMAECFTLFYLDLDGFKQVNDTLGHAAGDRLLREVGYRLRDCTRATDIVARQGGDEFIIAVPGMRPVEAVDFAGMVIRRISDHDYLLDGTPARIGISVGFACYPDDGEALDELQRKADAALYESKHAGRGTHRRYSEAAAPRVSRRLQRTTAA
jgi:diguanylate cyclase (GGDEF)-like protein